MSLSNLRPKIVVRQTFEEETPIVPDNPLPILLVALHRQFVHEGDAGSFVGGQPGQVYEFPSLIAGSIVEQPGAVLDVPEFPDVLEPHVYISNRYGKGEVVAPDLSYDFAVDPPTFSIAPGASVDFGIVENDNGTYSSVSGYFMDAEEDFIEAEVAAGDVIEVQQSDGDYYPMFDVVDILSDSQLDVIRRNKATMPAIPTAALGAVDAFGFRVLSDTNQTFEQAGVDANDLVVVDGWDTLISGLGANYGAVGTGTGLLATSRLFEDSTKDFGVLGVVAGNVIFSVDSIGDRVPFFYVTGGVGTTQITDVENMVTTPTAIPALTASAVGVPYDVVNYSAPVTLGPGLSSLAGEYGAQGATVDLLVPSQPTYRIFRDTTANFLAVGGVAAGDEIIIDVLGGAAPYFAPGNWPVFVVQAVLDATHLEISQHDSNSPLPAASTLGTFVSYEARTATPVAGAANYPATYTIEGGGVAPAGERQFDAAGKDFVAAGVAIGDYIQDVVTGLTLFRVTAVHPGAVVGRLFIENIIPGNPPAASSNPMFAFHINDQNPAIMRVTRVNSDTSVDVTSIVSGSPGAGTLTGLVLTSVVFPDAGQDAVYKIVKTVTGTALSGDVLTSYAARRTDMSNEITPFDVSNFESVLGPAVPGNDAGLAASIIFGILNSSALFIQVSSDTLAAWQTALELAETDRAYIPMLMTQREDVLALLRTHIDAMSLPEAGKERITYQSHKEVVQSTRTSESLGDALTYNKTGAGVTTIVSTTRDLTTYGVIVGDEFTGSLDDGTTVRPIAGARIISVQASTPTVGQSTIRIVASSTIPAPSTGPVTAWTIKSKTLSLLERAEAQAAYARGLQNRRIRNIWPYTVRLRFTDTTVSKDAVTGIFGGGDQIATFGGHYLALIEATKRSAENPKQPLTNLPQGTVYQIIDPMGDFEGHQNIIINGGNYYVVHAALDGAPYAIRAISTDVTTLERADDNMAPQFDAFARRVRRQMKPLMGKFILDDNYWELLSTHFGACRKEAIEVDKEIQDVVLLGILPDPDRPDKWIIKCRAVPFYGANEGEIDIYI